MKLSYALKKGSRGMRQVRWMHDNGRGAVCAIGAIALGAGLSYVAVENFMGNDLRAKIIRMNDVDGASFNKIYKYIKSRGL